MLMLLLHSKDPNEISQGQGLLLAIEILIDEFVEDVITLLLVLFFSIIDIEDYFTFDGIIRDRLLLYNWFGFDFSYKVY